MRAAIHQRAVLFKEGVCLSVQHTFHLLEIALRFPRGPVHPSECGLGEVMDQGPGYPTDRGLGEGQAQPPDPLPGESELLCQMYLNNTHAKVQSNFQSCSYFMT